MMGPHGQVRPPPTPPTPHTHTRHVDPTFCQQTEQEMVQLINNLGVLAQLDVAEVHLEMLLFLLLPLLPPPPPLLHQ